MTVEDALQEILDLSLRGIEAEIEYILGSLRETAFSDGYDNGYDEGIAEGRAEVT